MYTYQEHFKLVSENVYMNDPKYRNTNVFRIEKREELVKSQTEALSSHLLCKNASQGTVAIDETAP